MKLILESTARIVEINGEVKARVWEGKTESGIPVHCLVTRVAVDRASDQSQFEAELVEQKEPSEAAIKAFPLRLII